MKIIFKLDGSILEIIRGDNIFSGSNKANKIIVAWENPIDVLSSVQCQIARPDLQISGYLAMVYLAEEKAYGYTLTKWDTALDGEFVINVKWKDGDVTISGAEVKAYIHKGILSYVEPVVLSQAQIDIINAGLVSLDDEKSDKADTGLAENLITDDKRTIVDGVNSLHFDLQNTKELVSDVGVIADNARIIAEESKDIAADAHAISGRAEGYALESRNNAYDAKQISQNATEISLDAKTIANQAKQVIDDKIDIINRAGVIVDDGEPLLEELKDIRRNIRELEVVETIADRDALPADRLYEGFIVHVIDATADVTVESGWAQYLCLQSEGTTTLATTTEITASNGTHTITYPYFSSTEEFPYNTQAMAVFMRSPEDMIAVIFEEVDMGDGPIPPDNIKWIFKPAAHIPQVSLPLMPFVVANKPTTCTFEVSGTDSDYNGTWTLSGFIYETLGGGSGWNWTKTAEKESIDVIQAASNVSFDDSKAALSANSVQVAIEHLRLQTTSLESNKLDVDLIEHQGSEELQFYAFNPVTKGPLMIKESDISSPETYGLNYHNLKADPRHHIITIDIPTDNYTFNLYLESGATKDTQIYWGDGTNEKITSWGARQHEYAKAGTYEIVIVSNTGTAANMPQMFVNDQTDKDKYIKARYSSLLTTVGDKAFKGATNLRTIEFGTPVTSIGISAFEWCISLSGEIAMNQVQTIKERAFFYCYNLEYLSGLESIERIENGAFFNCRKITTLSTGYYLNYIGEQAFGICSSLKFIAFGSNNYISMSYNAFQNANGAFVVARHPENIDRYKNAMGTLLHPNGIDALPKVNTGDKIQVYGVNASNQQTMYAVNGDSNFVYYSHKMANHYNADADLNINMGDNILTIGNFTDHPKSLSYLFIVKESGIMKTQGQIVIPFTGLETEGYIGTIEYYKSPDEIHKFLMCIKGRPYDVEPELQMNSRNFCLLAYYKNGVKQSELGSVTLGLTNIFALCPLGT